MASLVYFGLTSTNEWRGKDEIAKQWTTHTKRNCHGFSVLGSSHIIWLEDSNGVRTWNFNENFKTCSPCEELFNLSAAPGMELGSVLEYDMDPSVLTPSHSPVCVSTPTSWCPDTAEQDAMGLPVCHNGLSGVRGYRNCCKHLRNLTVSWSEDCEMSLVWVKSVLVVCENITTTLVRHGLWVILWCYLKEKKNKPSSAPRSWC